MGILPSLKKLEVDGYAYEDIQLVRNTTIQKNLKELSLHYTPSTSKELSHIMTTWPNIKNIVLRGSTMWSTQLTNTPVFAAFFEYVSKMETYNIAIEEMEAQSFAMATYFAVQKSVFNDGASISITLEQRRVMTVQGSYFIKICKEKDNREPYLSVVYNEPSSVRESNPARTLDILSSLDETAIETINIFVAKTGLKIGLYIDSILSKPYVKLSRLSFNSGNLYYSNDIRHMPIYLLPIHFLGFNTTQIHSNDALTRLSKNFPAITTLSFTKCSFSKSKEGIFLIWMEDTKVNKLIVQAGQNSMKSDNKLYSFTSLLEKVSKCYFQESNDHSAKEISEEEYNILKKEFKKATIISVRFRSIRSFQFVSYYEDKSYYETIYIV